MDLPGFTQLLTPAGQAALADATALQPTEPGYLAAFEKLRKRHPPALARAALETAILRDRARAKFPLADRMYFTREALEQASSDLVARYRAARLASFATVLDLGCGIGADALALASAGCRVEAIDADPLRLAMARANAVACGFDDRIRFHLGDVLTMPLPAADAAFVDPSRREGGRRVLDPGRYQPPLGDVLRRFPDGFPLAAKIAPGIARSDLERFDAGVEFISAGGELKECVLWFGSLAAPKRMATVLPGPHTLAADESAPSPGAVEIDDFIFDPDPAVIRADLLGLLAEQLDADPVDHGIALLTGPHPADSPFADCYRVEHAAHFHMRRLGDELQARQIGRVTILKRAVEIDVNDVMRRLKLSGQGHRHLILTRGQGRTMAIIAEKTGADFPPAV